MSLLRNGKFIASPLEHSPGGGASMSWLVTQAHRAVCQASARLSSLVSSLLSSSVSIRVPEYKQQKTVSLLLQQERALLEGNGGFEEQTRG